MQTVRLFWILLLALSGPAMAQTALQTSFETAQGYTTGNLNGQNGWAVTAGSVSVTAVKAKTGVQSAQLSAANTALKTDYVAYGGSVPGITGEVYADLWINPVSLATRNFAVNGYDLYGGSSRRIFVVEFTPAGQIRAFNGSSSSTTVIGNWVSNQWLRISVKIDFATEKYKVAVNGVVYGTELNFRETYTPTASGTRQAGIKEFHSLRFNHVTDTDLATTDVAVDDVYAGTAAISDVSFGPASNTRTITVTQPLYGNIALSPAAPYTAGQTVTATLTLPQGYINNGWTGDLSGTELVKSFTVNANMTIGANVGIDAANPPPQYTVTINQPTNGIITLSPVAAGNMYYKETVVTATISYEACYNFTGWTGGLSGTQTSKSFTVRGPLVIGADVVLNTTPAVKRMVGTVTEFKNALAAMNPGDTIDVADGSYNLSSLSVTRSGCSQRPIIITARNKGAAILNGATALVFKNIKYLTFKGFSIQSSSIGTGIKLENCNKVRITENSFAITETSSCTWLYIGDTFASPEPLKSGYNRVDHNTFDGKTHAGNYIRMDGNIDQQSRYDTIDHNWFKNNGPRADNEKESIRVGVSTLSKSSGFTLIEYNLFQDCDGDPEVVSIKSCDNTIRYNTFQRCLGTLCLRQGFRSTVEGNYFFGEGKTAVFNGGTIGCGGIRVYAKDHKIINNYFQGLTGAKWDAAITITNGDVTNSSTSLSDHYLPENLVIAFNTLYNNKSNIEIGFDNNGNYPRAPINNLLVNNLVVDSTAPIIKSYSASSLAGVSFSNNIMYPTGASSIGITATASEINPVNPLLARPACTDVNGNCTQTLAYKIFRLSPFSPAINAATGSYPFAAADYEGQVRAGAKDIGADEFYNNNTLTVGPLDETQVGPNAAPFLYSFSYGTTLPANGLSFTASLNAGKVVLTWLVAEEKNVQRYEVEWSTDGRMYKKVETATAVGSVFYSATHAAPVRGKNFYRLKIVDKNGTALYSPVRQVTVVTALAVNLYPNPASNILFVGFNPTRQAATEVRLINNLGSVVYKTWLSGVTPAKLFVSQLPAGLYLLQLVENDKPVHTQNFSIVR